MSKNVKTLSLNDIEQKKHELQSDLDKITSQLQNMEKMKAQLTAQGIALNGAIQQCDVFASLLGEANPASSIPSQDDNAVQTALS